MQAETAAKKPLFLRSPQVKLCVKNWEAPEGGVDKSSRMWCKSLGKQIRLAAEKRGRKGPKQVKQKSIEQSKLAED
ncbi:hypothetical protein QUA03_16740 [Microcoleus sp. S36b_A4]|uniref:hypothetical protein n=1 Tax=Microcoleus sp. S36b_A4 TaxID=3055420 RepID=UPI002FD679A2